MRAILNPRLDLRDAAVTDGSRRWRRALAIHVEMIERIAGIRRGRHWGAYRRSGNCAAQKKFCDHWSAWGPFMWLVAKAVCGVTPYNPPSAARSIMSKTHR
jgi:hypothetical protein